MPDRLFERFPGYRIKYPGTALEHQDCVQLKLMTAGRDAACDLVLDHPTVSRTHAHIELADDGQVAVADAGSRNGTFLHRNAAWIRVRRVKLCIGDRIRLGEHEVALQRLTAVFGDKARLGAKHFSLRSGQQGSAAGARWDEPAAALQKPRRNPVTGKIEDKQA